MELKLKAQVRELNEKLEADILPAVLYGKEVENKSLKLNRIEFDKLFAQAGESNLIDLDFGDGAVKVLVKDLQRDVIKDTISHVDFYQVNMKEKVHAEVTFNFIGESKAVKELGGIFTNELDSVEIECMPSDLIDHIDIDISVLETFEEVIRVSDLKVPDSLRITNDPSNVVATVIAPRIIEEEAPVEAAEVEGENGEEKKEEGGEEKKEEAPAEKKE